MQLSDLQVGTKLKKDGSNYFIMSALINLFAVEDDDYNIDWFSFKGLESEGFTLAEPVQWKPAFRDTIWQISEDGEVQWSHWINSVEQLKQYEYGNYFKTEAEALARRDQIYKLNHE